MLAGIGEVESGHGRSALPGVRSGSNSAGAEGLMQFEPATFAEYAVNADPGQPLSPYTTRPMPFTPPPRRCAPTAPRGGTPAGLQKRGLHLQPRHLVRERGPGLGREKYATQGGSHAAATAIAFALAQARQALPVGRGRAERL